MESWLSGEDVFREDIKNNNSYVIVDQNEIVGTFAIIIGEEPTYKIIKNGNWHYNEPYGTIHRVASNSKSKGISKACFDFCFTLIKYIRVDTHQNNTSMQRAIKRYGSKECGNIYVRDGSERITFDYKYNN